MPPSELVKLSKSETEILGELLSGRNKAIEVSIPDDIDPKKAVQWSRATASLYDKNDGERAIILQCMGRLHYLARVNPEILREAKCESIKQYEEEVLRCRDQRSTVWKYSSAYKAFPELTPADAAAIGTTNLERASKIATGKSPAQKKKILEKAKEMATDEFKEWAETKSGLSSPGETTGASFVLYGTVAQIGELKTWLADAGFREWAATDHPLGMLLAAVQEATTQFTNPPDPIASEEAPSDEPEGVEW